MARRLDDLSAYPPSVQRLIEAFAALPGVGRRSAERMAFWVLKAPEETAMQLPAAIAQVKKTVRHCAICWNLSDQSPCPLCADPARDASTILIVEQPRDMASLEQSGMYRGLFHVLMGRLDPLSGVGEDTLTSADLLQRVREPGRNARGVKVQEVIFGLNPDLEGDTTALVLADRLKDCGVRLSRLGRGLSAGSPIEFASRGVLADAIASRQRLDPHSSR